MGFNPPDWASQPSRLATVEVSDRGAKHSIPVDAKACYVFGSRDAENSDIVLDNPGSRQHAALVHHEDGRIFLIDLNSTHGTWVESTKIAPNKPIHLKDNTRLSFGEPSKTYLLKCEAGAEKRKGNGPDTKDAKRLQTMTKWRASHLLVKHKGSRRASSWKEPVITRSLEEAMAKIQEFRRQLVAGEVDFATLASRESDCSSAQRGGDLGEFGPGQMQKAFEDGTSALAVGELSGPVVSDSGVHLILRTG